MHFDDELRDRFVKKISNFDGIRISEGVLGGVGGFRRVLILKKFMRAQG